MVVVPMFFLTLCNVSLYLKGLRFAGVLNQREMQITTNPIKYSLSSVNLGLY